MRVLMVCKGNICRSPLAAAVLARLGAERGLQLEVRSAATEERTAGRPAHELTRAVASRRGYDLDAHIAHRLTGGDVAWADRILAMDAGNMARIIELSGDDAASKTALLGPEIRDPYGLCEDAFEEVLSAIERACAALADELAARACPG